MKKIIFGILVDIIIIFSINVSVLGNGENYCIIEENSLRILNANNEHEIKLIASTTKIMTALITIEKYSLNNYITIEEEDTLIDGSKIYLEKNDKIRVIDLLYGLLLRSGNDCANAISRYYGSTKFIYEMNERCKSIGMINTTFNNPSGLDNDDYYNLSTAYDMSLLMIEAMKNDIFREIASTIDYKFKSYNNKSYFLTNKHRLVRNDDHFIAGKTGYTKKSGRVLVSYASINNMNVAITTIDDSNDWATHVNLLNDASNFTKSFVIPSYQYDLKNGYFICLDSPLVIPIRGFEKEKLKLTVKNKYLYAYIDDKLILLYKLKVKKYN